MLTLAILLSHCSIGELSDQAKELLYDQSTRCTKLLMQILQSKFGQLGGVQKMTEILGLVEQCFHTAYNFDLQYEYMEAFHLKKRINLSFPDPLKSLY